MTQNFCSPILYKIRQGASMVSYWLYVAIDATQNTGKKTSRMVDFIFSEALKAMLLFPTSRLIDKEFRGRLRR